MNLDKIDKFVKMCKEATELQENHKPEIGDYYYLNWLHEAYPDFKFRLDIETYLVREAPEWAGDTLSPWAEYFDDTVDYDTNIKNSTWLPRQDQLQDMFGDYESILGVLDNTIDRWHGGVSGLDFENMEELWLAIIMYEKYDKKWVDDKWVSQ